MDGTGNRTTLSPIQSQGLGQGRRQGRRQVQLQGRELGQVQSQGRELGRELGQEQGSSDSDKGGFDAPHANSGHLAQLSKQVREDSESINPVSNKTTSKEIDQLNANIGQLGYSITQYDDVVRETIAKLQAELAINKSTLSSTTEISEETQQEIEKNKEKIKELSNQNRELTIQLKTQTKKLLQQLKVQSDGLKKQKSPILN